MSGRKRGKHLSLSLLKRRGWTMELIDELLPRPRYVPVDGTTMRVWAKKDVLAAELTPQFAAGRTAGGEPLPNLSACANAARDALQQAWKREKSEKSINPKPGSWPDTTTPRLPAVSAPRKRNRI